MLRIFFSYLLMVVLGVLLYKCFNVHEYQLVKLYDGSEWLEKNEIYDFVLLNKTTGDVYQYARPTKNTTGNKWEKL